MTMFGLDLHTFLILVELLMAVYAATAFFVYVVRKHIMHLIMVLSFMAAFGAFVLMDLYLDGPSLWVIVLYNFLLVFSTVLIIAGYRIYFKFKSLPLRYYAYLILYTTFTWFFLDFAPSFIGRVGVSAFFMVLFATDAIIETLPAVMNESVKVRRVIFTVMGSLILFNILRLIVVLVMPTNNVLVQNMATTALTSGFFMIFSFNFWLTGSMILQSDRLVSSLHEENQKMEDLAMLDPLTKLYNRNKLEEDLQRTIELSNRQGDIASIILMDLDHFKEINDQLGHDVGDQVLTLAASSLTSLLREEDRVYRWGGDEFLILTPQTDLKGATRLAERIIKKFEEMTLPGHHSLSDIKTISLSLGIAQHFQFETKADWFKRVDLALYKAKQAGRNRYEVWSNDEMLPAAMAKLIWSEAFACGHTEIDRQHKNLLRLSNELYDRLGSADSMMEMNTILDRVAAELTEHFTYESNLMRETHFPLVDQHQHIHDQLLKDFALLREQMAHGLVNLSVFFNFVSTRIVAEHIIKEDTKFFAHLKSLQG